MGWTNGRPGEGPSYSATLLGVGGCRQCADALVRRPLPTVVQSKHCSVIARLQTRQSALHCGGLGGGEHTSYNSRLHNHHVEVKQAACFWHIRAH